MTWHGTPRTSNGTRPHTDRTRTEYRAKARLPDGTKKTWRTQSHDTIITAADKAAARYPTATIWIEHRITSDWTYTQPHTTHTCPYCGTPDGHTGTGCPGEHNADRP